MKTLCKFSAVTTTAAALALLSLAPIAHAAPSGKMLRTGAHVPAKAKTVTFAVSKMHCEGCASGLVQAAKGWKGVKSANVSYAQKRALVTFDPKKTDSDKIAKEFNRIGFPAKVVN